MLYAYLKQFNGISASHTSGTGMGTDWRDNDPNGEPVVEIYQGIRQNYEMADAPRANNEKDSIGGWRPKGYVNIALDKGYRLGFESSSDHIFDAHQLLQPPGQGPQPRVRIGDVSKAACQRIDR